MFRSTDHPALCAVKSEFTDIQLDVVAAHAGNAEAGRRSGVADGLRTSLPAVGKGDWV